MRATSPASRSAAAGAPALLDAVTELRAGVVDLALPLEAPGVEAARTERTGLLDQLDDYLLPRLRRLDAPLLAVVGGSTGAGKSTLVNSLVGRTVTGAGVLRPTTRQPVLVHAPADTAWFTSGDLLPALARSTGAAAPEGGGASPRAGGGAGPRAGSGTASGSEPAGVRGLRLVADPDAAEGLGLLDAPDVDSVVDANRELALQLLGAADLWLFVTTAARYADAVPWEVLRTATERGTAVAVVLDRVPPEALGAVRTDLARMLTDAGMTSAPLFTVVESDLVDGRLPDEQLAPLKRWLAGITADARSRDVVVRRTLSGALASLGARTERLAEAADAQAAEESSLRAELDASYADAAADLREHLADGTLLRGEVLARWHEFVGTGEVLRGLQTGVGRLRDRVVAAVRGRPAPAQRLEEALTTGVRALVLDAAGTARERSLLRWRARRSGAGVLAGAVAQHGPRVGDPRPAEALPGEVERLVRDWQGRLLDLVRREGQGRRSRAIALSLGVSGAGAVLMLVVFAASAGLTGAEGLIAVGTAGLAQRVLEAAFGDQAVRSLSAQARADLLERVDALLAAQRAQLADLLPSLRRAPDPPDAVGGAVPGAAGGAVPGAAGAVPSDGADRSSSPVARTSLRKRAARPDRTPAECLRAAAAAVEAARGTA